MTENKKNPLAAVKKWLYSLSGKTPQSGSENQFVSENSSQVTQKVEEDSVANDIKMFKSFAKKGAEKIKTTLRPFAKKGTSVATSTTAVVGTSLDKKFLKTTIRFFFILFFILVLVFIAIYFLRMLKNGGVISQNPQTIVTPVPFVPFKPSVYADDPEVLKIEEDLTLLERELNQVKIKEDGIDPPKLDFDISF